MINFADIYQAVNRVKSEIPYRTMNGYAFPPVLTQIELTYICNVRCEFCQFFQFQEGGDDWGPTENELKLDEVKAVIDQAPGQVLSFTGGEPLGRRDVKEIISYAARKHRIHIISNGTFLYEPMVDFLTGKACRNILSKGLFFLEFSIHGIGEVHDEILRVKEAYRRAMGGLERLQEAKRQKGLTFPKTTMKVVVVQKNSHQVLDLYKKAAEVGTDLFNIMCYQHMEAHYQRFKYDETAEAKGQDAKLRMDTGFDWEDLRRQLNEIVRLSKEGKGPLLRWTPIHMTPDELIRYYKGEIDLGHYGCHSPWSKVYVSAFGDIYICPFTKIGNVRNVSLKEAWNNHMSRQFRRDLKKGGLFPGCVGCCNMEYNGKK